MITGAILIGAAICADRFILKRNKASIEHTRLLDDEKSIRFALGFTSSKSISIGRLVYSLRSKTQPSAVLAFDRPILNSKKGFNSEYITFSRASLEREFGGDVFGEWILDVKIEYSSSRLNPLYKIFPMTASYTEEFLLT